MPSASPAIADRLLLLRLTKREQPVTSGGNRRRRGVARRHARGSRTIASTSRPDDNPTATSGFLVVVQRLSGRPLVFIRLRRQRGAVVAAPSGNQGLLGLSRHRLFVRLGS